MDICQKNYLSHFLPLSAVYIVHMPLTCFQFPWKNDLYLELVFSLKETL